MSDMTVKPVLIKPERKEQLEAVLKATYRGYQKDLGHDRPSMIINRSKSDPNFNEELQGMPLAPQLDAQGNVIRDKDHNIIWVTNSEAVSYALLRAVMMDDRPTFNLVWKWAQKHMQRKNIEMLYNGDVKKWWDFGNFKKHDHLFAWMWTPKADGKTGGVVLNPRANAYGYDPAADADQDIAAALLMAHQKWGNPYEAAPKADDPNRIDYYGEARLILNDIWQLETVDLEGKRVLIAGDNFSNTRDPFTGKRTYGIDPSYFRPYYYESLFAAYDPDHDWASMVKPTYDVIGLAQHAVVHDELAKEVDGTTGLVADFSALSNEGDVKAFHEEIKKAESDIKKSENKVAEIEENWNKAVKTGDASDAKKFNSQRIKARIELQKKKEKLDKLANNASFIHDLAWTLGQHKGQHDYFAGGDSFRLMFWMSVEAQLNPALDVSTQRYFANSPFDPQDNRMSSVYPFLKHELDSTGNIRDTYNINGAEGPWNAGKTYTRGVYMAYLWTAQFFTNDESSYKRLRDQIAITPRDNDLFIESEKQDNRTKRVPEEEKKHDDYYYASNWAWFSMALINGEVADTFKVKRDLQFIEASKAQFKRSELKGEMKKRERLPGNDPISMYKERKIPLTNIGYDFISSNVNILSIADDQKANNSYGAAEQTAMEILEQKHPTYKRNVPEYDEARMQLAEIYVNQVRYMTDEQIGTMKEKKALIEKAIKVLKEGMNNLKEKEPSYRAAYCAKLLYVIDNATRSTLLFVPQEIYNDLDESQRGHYIVMTQQEIKGYYEGATFGYNQTEGKYFFENYIALDAMLYYAHYLIKRGPITDPRDAGKNEKVSKADYLMTRNPKASPGAEVSLEDLYEESRCVLFQALAYVRVIANHVSNTKMDRLKEIGELDSKTKQDLGWQLLGQYSDEGFFSGLDLPLLKWRAKGNGAESYIEYIPADQMVERDFLLHSSQETSAPVDPNDLTGPRVAALRSWWIKTGLMFKDTMLWREHHHMEVFNDHFWNNLVTGNTGRLVDDKFWSHLFTGKFDKLFADNFWSKISQGYVKRLFADNLFKNVMAGDIKKVGSNNEKGYDPEALVVYLSRIYNDLKITYINDGNKQKVCDGLNKTVNGVKLDQDRVKGITSDTEYYKNQEFITGVKAGKQ